MSILERLAARIMLPSGKPRDGALSRVSEHLQVSRTTVKNWLSGEWSPGKSTLARIEDLLGSGKSLGDRRIRGKRRFRQLAK